MKEQDDEEIQRMLDEGLNFSEELQPEDELSAMDQYQFLFEKLTEEPEAGLPYNFASKVKARVQQKVNRKKDIQFYVMSLLVLAFGFTAFCELLGFINANAGNQFILVLSKLKWLIVSAALVLVAVLFLDQKLVKERVPKKLGT